ncbi:MAG TPA: PAS domain S-box protein, partial [Nitrospira sp.]|nr:PAS domain S-box protein [Nitrospira sp.]
MKRQLTGKLLTEVKGHGVALLATIGALVWRLALDPYLGDELPYVPFFVAIALTTWYAGLAASLTAIVLSALSANWFFIPPRLSLHIGDRSQVIGLLTFGAVSLIFMAFGHSMHRGRKRAEELAEGLRVTEERLTLAQEASQVGSFDWNLETGISTWSPELCAIYGIRPGDLDKTKAGWERYLHPDDREDVIQTIERSRTSGGAEEREFRIVRPNGDVRWLVARWRWIRNRAGQPVRFTGVTLDITERKRADEASREGEARSRAIFESALDALITMDAEGRVQDFNPAAERMFGYSQSEALGQPVADLIIPPPLRDRHREGLRQYVAAGDPAMLGRRIQMTAMRADGTEIPVELSIVVTQRPGRAPFFTASVRDLTERLKGEAATHQLASVLDNSTDFIGMCDLKGVPFYVNKYGLSMVGLESLEEAQSTHITQFFFPEDVDLIVNEF